MVMVWQTMRALKNSIEAALNELIFYKNPVYETVIGRGSETNAQFSHKFQVNGTSRSASKMSHKVCKQTSAKSNLTNHVPK